MKPVDRQKMCPNCDGRIPYDATQCPYCFTALQVDNSTPKSFNSPQETLSALYTPPYSSKSTEEPKNPKMAAKEAAATLEKEEVSETQEFWPILMLIMGGNLLTLGLLQFFFSDHGRIQLDINGSYWFLIILASIPLLYFGIKKVTKN
jgi:hypothetical protein